MTESTDVEAVSAELAASVERLEAVQRALREAKEELLNKARYLESATDVVEDRLDNRRWRIVIRAILIASLSSVWSALTFLAFLWLYRHNLLPWW